MEQWREELYHSEFYQNEIMHHGILGQKWGVRRYQNEDGTLTDLGRKKYGKRFLSRQKEIEAYNVRKKEDEKIYNYSLTALNDLEKKGEKSKTYKEYRKGFVGKVDDPEVLSVDFLKQGYRHYIKTYGESKNKFQKKINDIKNTPINKLTSTEKKKVVNGIRNTTIALNAIGSLAVYSIITGNLNDAKTAKAAMQFTALVPSALTVAATSKIKESIDRKVYNK